MIKIDIFKNMNDYDVIDINTDEGSFKISFQGNLDLYWSFRPNSSVLEHPKTKTFIITKENYFLYKLIEELNDCILNDKPYSNCIFDYEGKDSSSIFPMLEKLVIDNKIKWHSDDSCYEEASILGIEKIEDSFCITFEKGKERPTFNVRFTNSGSRYNPFNVTFMNMYNKLREYDTEYHQIHMEEILYEKAKTKQLK